jgi:hypothetical protein
LDGKETHSRVNKDACLLLGHMLILF